MSVNKLYNMLSTLFSSSLSRAMFIPETLPAGAAKSSLFTEVTEKVVFVGTCSFLTG